MHACLIVDNPLRDLDGLVMLAWQLAQRGATSYIVPMYEQGFDVPALQPDVVVANYVRPNNRDLLIAYRNAGMRVAILDTEGIAGKHADQFAQMVSRMDCASFVDAYYVWGERQLAAFRAARVLAPGALRATGCPRYDFCAPQWATALPRPGEPAGYVLVNTNFPTVNPRFARTSAQEERTMILAGYAEDFARRFVADARIAHEAVKRAVRALARRFPDSRFVLRPHPFERLEAYTELADAPNVAIRQEGTSLEWLSQARLLVHQNCSTAIEASMLKRPAVSLEWFNTESLRLESPTAVSYQVHSQAELEALVAGVLTGCEPRPSPEQVKAQGAVIRDWYYANDGRAAERVADALIEVAADPRRLRAQRHRSTRGVLIDVGRRVLGHRTATALRRRLDDSGLAETKEAKYFSLDQVRATLTRITRAAGAKRSPRAGIPSAAETRRPRLFSSTTVCIEP